MSEFTFDVFLSHNSKDKPDVERLAAELKLRNRSSWLDKEQLPPGQNWQRLIEQGLQKSRAIAACFGRTGIGPWQDEEMQAAMSLAVKQGRPVIPVLLPGAPNQPAIPLLLTNRGWVDFRNGFTPANLDDLVWGITGIHPSGGSSAPPPPPPPPPPPRAPAEYERRVREVFGAQYDRLKAILDANDDLRAFLTDAYAVSTQDTHLATAALLTAFHADFIKAIGHFARGCRSGAISSSVTADLLAGQMFLSMCPDYAAGLLAKEDSRVFEIHPKAHRGIAEMLVAWVDTKGKGAVPLTNLSGERTPGVFQTSPQMMAKTIKEDLMDRVMVDKNAPDAAAQLDIELDWRRQMGQREFLKVAGTTEAEKAVVRDLENSQELRHAVLLVVSETRSIHPAHSAGDPDHEQRLETFLQKLVAQLKPSTTSKTTP